MAILCVQCGHNLPIVNVTHNENLQNNLMIYVNNRTQCEDGLLPMYIHNICIIIVINSLLTHAGGRVVCKSSRENKAP